MTEEPKNPPGGATHWQDFYGATQFYKKTLHSHLNQVSEKWQKLEVWQVWNPRTHTWESVGRGFSSRLLRSLPCEMKA